ncbi:MAG: betaine/proline/choline family ABC transporter ATP-binding protein [Actinomycetales bacterium]|nr:betaine/proline/choline family ABC transporter ATP-binding protein [Actinomycetales bacterium]
MSSISVHHVYKIFGRRPRRGIDALQRGASRGDLRDDGLTAAVIDASFEVESGEIFVVMGLSGSGKSTLIRVMNNLHEPTHGHVEIDGVNVTRAKGEELRRLRRDKVSMVFQHFALLPHRTVGENAAYALEIQGMSRAERERRAEEALAMVDLGGWGGALPGELSGGMRQRVGLARALASGTDVLLMDEAFSALDPLIRRDMQEQLVELQDRLNKTILFITHDLNEAMRLGDRIAMMRDGRIEQIGTAEQILNDPANNYVAQFVQDVDRTRVLTAENLMEPPVAVVGRDVGPLAAQKLMRENQMSAILSVNPDRTLNGLLLEPDVAAAVAARRTELPLLPRERTGVVSTDTLLTDLFALAAERPGPLIVTDERDRVVGLVPHVTLFAAAGSNGSEPDEAPERGPDSAHHVLSTATEGGGH